MTKKLLLIPVILAIAVVIIWKFQSRPQSAEFSGHIRQVQGNNLTVMGAYVTGKIDQHSDIQLVEVIIDENTSFRKTVIQAPSIEQLKNIKNPADLAPTQKVTSGSLADLKNRIGLSVTIRSDSNVWGKQSFHASEISYTIQ
ncbi:hypothetical protein KW791_03530 [Candidatus Parcubacteria bacterium]|nr:hypothetical protein [Candidatus Parcubacteria bacterium]